MRLQVRLRLSSNDSSQSVICAVPVTAITSTIVKPSSLLPCTYSEKQAEMSGAFAALKVRDNINTSKDGNGSGSGSSWAGSDQKSQSSHFQSTSIKATGDRDSNPVKYNEKFMMSIWGLYNKYSVHNIKSHNTFENKH